METVQVEGGRSVVRTQEFFKNESFAATSEESLDVRQEGDQRGE
jgi:hypothetical protein